MAKYTLLIPRYFATAFSLNVIDATSVNDGCCCPDVVLNTILILTSRCHLFERKRIIALIQRWNSLIAAN